MTKNLIVCFLQFQSLGQRIPQSCQFWSNFEYFQLNPVTTLKRESYFNLLNGIFMLSQLGVQSKVACVQLQLLQERFPVRWGTGNNFRYVTKSWLFRSVSLASFTNVSGIIRGVITGKLRKNTVLIQLFNWPFLWIQIETFGLLVTLRKL